MAGPAAESGSAAATGSASPLPSLEEAMASKLDVWGEAAMKQPNGASYEFFKPILPPLRYVNADFRYYPLTLTAPRALVKARLISNGSGVNLRGGARSWNNPGIPVTFRVGPDEFLFGGLRERVSQPTLAEGWLPIFEIRYLHQAPQQGQSNLALAQPKPQMPPEIYRLEAFASTEPALSKYGVVFVQFDLAQGERGRISAEFEPADASFANGAATNQEGVVAVFDSSWKHEGRVVAAPLKPGTKVVLAIATRPLPPETKIECTAAAYAAQREACAQTWRELLAPGMNLVSPEPIVNNAWRHLLVQNFGLENGDSIHYSAGNGYDRIYESEGSDAAMALLGWGFASEVRKLLVPLLDFTRKDLELHQAGFKLNDVCQYYWQTRDAAALTELRPRWEKEGLRLALEHTNEFGLCPKQQYCGDISTMVYSLTVDAKGWRALRDLGAVLHEAGDEKDAQFYSENAAEFKKAVLAAIEKSAHREVSPPFVPVALYSDEPTHDPITATRIGLYWNIVIGYVIGSGIFPPGSEEETWIPHYQEQHGGVCMGMLRAGGGYTFWPSASRFNPLYGTRYVLDTLRRDEPERALVSFYGMLAQGLTRNTFVGAEGCSFTPTDEGGRFMYLPPNSAANAHALATLRGMLVQDWDFDNDGTPETLRLLFATPKRWLEDGKSLKLERAPTAFGPVSLAVQSHLARGEVDAQVELPSRNPPSKVLLRIRVPDGWKVTAAHVGERVLKVDPQGTCELAGLRGKAELRFSVAQ